LDSFSTCSGSLEKILHIVRVGKSLRFFSKRLDGRVRSRKLLDLSPRQVHKNSMSFAQSFLCLDDAQEDAVALMGDHGQAERGGIYTKREVVDFILDLVGYEETVDLTAFRILEPSCGAGDFLIPIVERLLSSASRKGISFLALTA